MLRLLLFKSNDEGLLRCVLLLEESVYIVVGMHQLLHCVDSVVVAKYAVHSCPSVALATLEMLLTWNQAIEELSDLHVLSYVGWSVTKLVLLERVCLGFLDKEDDTVSVAILTRIMQRGVLIRIFAVPIS